MATNPPATKSTFEADFDRFIQTTLEAIPTIPGLSVAVVKDGKAIYTKGFGYADKENGIVATANTSFYIASSTKSFTGLMAALLDEKGVIQLDDPVTAYLPAELFPEEVNKSKCATCLPTPWAWRMGPSPCGWPSPASTATRS